MAKQVARDVGLALVLGEEPGADDDESGLRGIRRAAWRCRRRTASDARPSPRRRQTAPRPSCTSIRPSMKSARRRIWRRVEEGNGDHRDPAPGSCRRSGASRSGSCRGRCVSATAGLAAKESTMPNPISDRKRGEEPAVDGPPPVGDRASVEATNASVSSLRWA